jgi:hypothetical protein
LQAEAGTYEEVKEEPRIREEGRFKFLSRPLYLIIGLLIVKTLFQIIILDSGYRWLSADDFTRTVKSYEWLQNPEISSGVWLTPHFWIVGFVMIFVKNLMLASNIVSSVFSAVCMVYYFKLIDLCFNRRIAIFSTLIFIFFPFQVWLSLSGLPEPIFFCFTVMGAYYFLKWRNDGKAHRSTLVYAAISFALSNVFRYEGWFFSAAFIVLVAMSFFPKRKLTKELVYNVLTACISLSTIAWWFLQNYFDHGNAMFFAVETTKIFDQFNSAGLLQRTVQYPTFIFYIAPLTTILSIKVIFDTFKERKSSLHRMFLMLNLLQLSFLIIHAMLGTGGTNMISRYIVVNALFLVPFAVEQIFEFKKVFAVILLAAIVIINIQWCFFFPPPFREDTFEVGNLMDDMIDSKYFSDKGMIYFEEIEGYYDLFALQALSNEPGRFVLGELREGAEQKPVSKNKSDDLNILAIKTFLEKKNIELAVIKSDGYSEKLSKMGIENEEIGEYKVFYVKGRKTSVSDSTISIFSKNLLPLEENPDLINYNKMLGLKSFDIDNTNFGLNPSTVTISWMATDTNIIDSIDYKNFEFDRYKYVVEIVNPDNDSTVYSLSNRIFSERNIETLIEQNEIRNIVVLRPFAVLNYSTKYGGSPFEGGVYTIALKVWDEKRKSDLLLFKGDKYLTPDINTDTAEYKTSDTSKVFKKIPFSPKDTVNIQYPLGNIIAMFPDSDYEKVLLKHKDFLEITTTNWVKLLFSQRYQGDQVLNWVFNYF